MIVSVIIAGSKDISTYLTSKRSVQSLTKDATLYSHHPPHFSPLLQKLVDSKIITAHPLSTITNI